MEQRVLNTRTVRTIGANGLENFTTVVLDSLHYESHLICTNCGPLGLKADVELSTNRAALSDRSWAHIVHSNEDHETGDVDFDVQKCSDDVKQQVNRYRVLASLVAYVLIFIKHIPSCKPNLSYANLLCNKWYEILWTEYNLPRPSKRKKIKLRMMLELFAVESAVFEKFGLPESGIDFADMRPDEDGRLTPFCIEQLVDVVCSLQRCVDHEVILNAWSHSLDHSPATAAHTFQMKTVLAQLHGSELDRRVLVGDPVPQAAPAAPEPAPQGRGAEAAPVYDAEFLDAAESQQFNDLPLGADAGNAAAEVAMAEPPPASAPGSVVAPAVQPRTGTPDDWDQRNSTRSQPPNNERGQPTHPVYPLAVQTMKDSMTRQRAADTAEELAVQRELRCELSSRGLTTKIAREGSEHGQVTKILTDVWDKNEPKHRMGSTGRLVDARRAAGACMPNATDLLNRGMDMGFLLDIANGRTSTHFGIDEAKIGIRKKGWEFETLPGEVVLKGPADFDFNWARLTAFVKHHAAAEGAVALPGGAKQKSLWMNSARVIKQASASGMFSLMAHHSMSVESMRDVLFMIAWSPIENKIRIPKKVHVNRWAQAAGRASGGFNIEDACMESGGYAITDAKAATSGIHPKHMFQGTDMTRLVPEFESPAGMQRPLNSTVGLSLGQKRLDHLTNHRALPTCIMPEGFERGVPIKPDDSFNGIYFNKHTGSEHAAFVLETGLKLATVPGIAGGRFTSVPDSFKGTHPNPSREKDWQDAQLEEARQQQRQPAAAAAAAAASSSTTAAGPTFDPADLIAGIDFADDQDVGPNQLRVAPPSEPDAEESYLEEQPQTPSLPEADAGSDHDSVQHSVSYPDSADTGVRPEPGASDRAARASVDTSAAVPSLPYEWDQLAMFFSIKMVETLHNDVHPYVDKYRSKFPDVYSEEEREETLAALPHISIRFPGVVDARSKETGEEKTKELLPLSCSVPLEQSRFCDVAKHIKSTRASKGLTEAVHSFSHGRSIAFNDPEVLEQEAEARGLDSGITMDGNLFARSTWVRFTLSALDARGMCTPEEEARVADQGLCMRLRVRNKRSAATHEDADPALHEATEAKPRTFSGQERQKRKLGDTDEDDEAPMESLSCKRRNLEIAREKELLDESMDLEPSV